MLDAHDRTASCPERFLQQAAQNNLTIAMPSTPASYFHFLRDHALSQRRAPLVVFTPKSMLRLKAAVSAATDLTEGQLQPVIGDAEADPTKVSRVLLCTGKITWDLMAARNDQTREDIAIVRIEQLYPLNIPAVHAALAWYSSNADFVWVQEEPENQGAWTYMLLNLVPHLDRVLTAITREASASTATGSHNVHAREQADLVTRALG